MVYVSRSCFGTGMRSYNLKELEQKAREQRDSLSTDAHGGQLKSAQTSGSTSLRLSESWKLEQNRTCFFLQTMIFLTALFPSFCTIYSRDRKWHWQGKG
jgi:hypothetical protein